MGERHVAHLLFDAQACLRNHRVSVVNRHLLHRHLDAHSLLELRLLKEKLLLVLLVHLNYLLRSVLLMNGLLRACN